ALRTLGIGNLISWLIPFINLFLINGITSFSFRQFKQNLAPFFYSFIADGYEIVKNVTIFHLNDSQPTLFKP
ncbi:MAG TPA: hypothetical protein PLO43_05390, partial [Chlamydiales bacterium]|nr:hypothetical protein [Chlamydiales bacterium]